MAEERLAGQGLQVPDNAKMALCPECGELFFVAKLTDGGKEVLVQPVVVRGLIPDVELVQGVTPTSPEELITKVVSRAATARFSPPLLIPHNLVCIRAPLIRSLPAPTRPVAPGPEPPKGDPRVPPPGHKPVVHDLEIQNGKIGTSSRIPSEDPEDPEAN